MAGLAAALVNLAAIQLAATVTVEEVVYKIDQVFTGPVPGNVSPTAPYIQNIFTFPDQDDVLAQNVHRYEINSQWFLELMDVADENTHLMVTKFWEHWLNLWVNDQRLTDGGAATIISGIMVGAPALLDGPNDLKYLGLDVILSCQLERDTSA